MIYTIGYQCLTPQRLREIAVALDATVIDVRSIPKSRKAGFGQRQLKALLPRYMWLGNELGGISPVKLSGIIFLRDTFYTSGENCLLLCMEHAPGDCHRHHAICIPDFDDAVHICGDEVVLASELQRALDEDDDYECSDLSDLINPA